ncbi:MAG: class I SAM-dependent methyltransferase [Myxococcales bacterium]|nr:class I SAM-dependent methyltransferase [Myxococcales bacterium]
MSIEAAERGVVPDVAVRWAIRRLLRARLKAERAAGAEDLDAFVAWMADGPVAEATGDANAQHYAVPPAFFEAALGPWLKYSCGYWPTGVETLAKAEETMLGMTAARAGVEDGMRVLDLGCGWGSFTLWVASQMPGVQVHAVSNSAPQRAYIERACVARGLRNVRVTTCDVNVFDPGERYDRVVSVEMFEHVRNWPTLFERVAGWLEPAGRFFQHVFCHRSLAYRFEVRGDAPDPSDWMARHFFTGGLMPAFALPESVPGPLTVERQWRVDGTHYAQTCEAWLANVDGARDAVLDVLGPDPELARRRYHRWRLFFLACAELFGFRGGEEWFVAHTLLRRR